MNSTQVLAITKYLQLTILKTVCGVSEIIYLVGFQELLRHFKSCSDTATTNLL